MNYENRTPGLGRVDKNVRDNDFIPIIEFKELSQRVDEIVDKLSLTNSNNSAVSGLTQKIKEIQFHLEDALIYNDAGEIVGFNELIDESGASVPIKGPESFTTLLETLHDYYNEFVKCMGSDPTRDNWKIELEKYYSAAINEFRNKINSAFTSSANISILETKNNIDSNYIQNNTVSLEKQNILRLNPDIISYTRSLNIIPKTTNEPTVIFEVQEAEKKTLVLNLKVQNGFMYYDLDIILDKGKWFISKESLLNNDTLSAGQFYIDIYRYALSQTSDSYVFCLRTTYPDLTLHYNFEITSILVQRYNFDITNLDVSSHTKYYAYNEIETLGIKPIYNQTYYTKTSESYVGSNGVTVERDVYVPHEKLLEFEAGVTYYTRDVQFTLVKSYDLIGGESDGNIDKNNTLKTMKSQVVVEDINYNGDLSLLHVSYDINDAFDNFNGKISEKNDYLKKNNKLSPNNAIKLFNTTKNRKPSLAKTFKNMQLSDTPETVGAYGDAIFELTKLEPGKAISTNCFLNIGATNLINDNFVNNDVPVFNSATDENEYISVGPIMYKKYIEKWRVMSNEINGNILAIVDNFNGVDLLGYDLIINKYINENISFIDNIYIHVFEKNADDSGNNKYYQVIIIPDSMVEGKINPKLKPGQLYYSFDINLPLNDDSASITSIVYRSFTSREPDEYLISENLDLEECYGLISNKTVTLAFGKTGIYHSFYGDVWYKDAPEVTNDPTKQISKTSEIRIHNTGIFNNENSLADFDSKIRTNCTRISYLNNSNNKYFQDNGNFYVFTDKTVTITENSEALTFNLCYISEDGFNWHVGICPTFTDIKFFNEDRIVFFDANNNHSAKIVGYYILKIGAGLVDLNLNDDFDKYDYSSFCTYFNENITDIKIRKPATKYLNKTLVTTDELPNDYPGCGALDVPKTDYEETISRFYEDHDPDEIATAAAVVEYLPIYDVGYNNTSWFINCGEAFFFAKDDADGVVNKIVDFSDDAQENVTSGMALPDEELYDLLPFYGSFHPEDRFDFTKYKIHASKYGDFIIYLTEDPGNFGNTGAKPTNARFPVFICNDGVIFKIPNVNLTSYFTSNVDDPSQPDIYHSDPKQVHLFDQYCRGGTNHDITFLNLIGTESFMVDMLEPTVGTNGDINERTELMNLIETPDEIVTLRDNNGVTYYIRSNSTTFNEYCVNNGQTEMYGESNEDISQYAARKIFNIPTTSSIDEANEYQGSLTILVGPNGLQVKKYTSAVEVFNPVSNLNDSTYEDVKAVECQRLQYHPFPRLLKNATDRNYNEKTAYCVCVDGKMYFTKTDHTTPIPLTFVEAHVCDDNKIVTNIYNLNRRTYIGTKHKYYERNYGYDDTYIKTNFFADTYMINTIKEFNNNILVFEDVRSNHNSSSDPLYILHQLHWDKNTNDYIDNPINVFIDGYEDDPDFAPTINDLIISVNSCQGYTDENNDNEYVDNKYLFITGQPDLYEDGLWYAHYDPSSSDITFYQSWDCDFGKINGFCENSEGLFIYGTNFDGGEEIWFSDKDNGMPTFTPLLTVDKIDCVQVVDDELYISAYDSTKPTARYSFNKETKRIEYVNAISSSDVASFNYVIEHFNSDKFIINGSGANDLASKGFFKVNKNIVTGNKMVINFTKISKDEDDVIFEKLFNGKTDNTSKVTYNSVPLTSTLELISLNINDDTTDLITRIFAIDITNGNLTIIHDSSNNLQVSQNINCDILKNISNLITNVNDNKHKLIFEKNFYSIKIVDDEELNKFKIDEIYFDKITKTFDIDYSNVSDKTISFLNNNTFAVNTTHVSNETYLAMALGKNSLGVSIENKLAVYDKANSIFKVSNLQYTASSSEASANVELDSDNYEILTILIGANGTSSNIYLLIRGKFPNVVYNRNTNQVTLDYNVSESNIVFKASINDFLSNNDDNFTLTVCEGYSFDGINVEIAKEVMKEFVISNYMDSPNQDINFNVTPINETDPLIYIGSFIGLVYNHTYTAVYFNYERNCFHFKTDMIYTGEIDESRNIDKGIPFTSSKIIDGEDYFIGKGYLIRDNKDNTALNSTTDYVNIPGNNETIGLNLTNKKMINILHNNDLLCKNSERMYGRHMQTQYGVFRYMPNNFVYDIKEDPQTSYFYNYMNAKHPDTNYVDMLNKPTMNIIQDINGNTIDTGTSRNNGYHAWFTPEGINKVTEIIAPEGGSIVKIYETLRGLFIEALVPDEHNSSVIHGGHKLYRMDKIPTDAHKSTISLSDNEYFTEVSIYGKYITQFEDTEYGLLANVAPLIEYKNNYIEEVVSNKTTAEINVLYNASGIAVEEYEEIPKIAEYVLDGFPVCYMKFNNLKYSGLCEKNNKYFDFDYTNDDPDVLEPYILKYNGDDFINILDSKRSYAIDYLTTIKSTPGAISREFLETPPYKKIYGTRGEPDAISKFVLDGSHIIFINKFDRTTINAQSTGYTPINSQSYMVESINLSDIDYLKRNYYWPSNDDMQQRMMKLNDTLPTSFYNDTRLCYPSKETNEYTLVSQDEQNLMKSKVEVIYNQSETETEINFDVIDNSFSISNGESGDFDNDGNCYRTLIAYPFIQKSVTNTKKYLIDLTKSMTSQNVPIDTNLKVIGNIIYKNHKITVNGLRIVSEDGDSDNLKELVFNIDDEFRTDDEALLHEIKDGILTITNDNYFKKCDLNVFYFNE